MNTHSPPKWLGCAPTHRAGSRGALWAGGGLGARVPSSRAGIPSRKPLAALLSGELQASRGFISEMGLAVPTQPSRDEAPRRWPLLWC